MGSLQSIYYYKHAKSLTWRIKISIFYIYNKYKPSTMTKFNSCLFIACFICLHISKSVKNRGLKNVQNCATVAWSIRLFWVAIKYWHKVTDVCDVSWHRLWSSQFTKFNNQPKLTYIFVKKLTLVQYCKETN